MDGVSSVDALDDHGGVPDAHAFAPFLAALGRGPGRSRHLTRAEAEAAFGMLLREECEPIQAGAFLLLLRYRSESPDEMAGFASAARAYHGWPAMGAPEALADLDWPSYAAGRSRGAPWFLLSAVLLARAGIRVVMHGHNGLGDLRGSTEAAVRALGLHVADDMEDARAAIGRDGFAYLPLERLSPRLTELVELRRLLGLRTPVNTLLRLMNPSAAPALVAGAFHPPYLPLHVASARLLGQPRFASFKGGGGEAERNPLKACPVTTIVDGAEASHTWPALLGEGRGKRREKANLPHLLAVWRREIEDDEAEATVIATTAVALVCARPGIAPEAADIAAREMWERR